jgi:hypothetical protein
MTAPFDAEFERIRVRLNRLSPRVVAAFYVGVASALRPEYLRWALHRGRAGSALLDRALNAASEFAIAGLVPPDLAGLLGLLEAEVPEGESPDGFSPTRAQDCWICADSAVRQIDGSFPKGDAVWYALEPTFQHWSERLFGVTEFATPDEETGMRTVLAAPEVAEAIGFCDWFVERFDLDDGLSAEDLQQVVTRAAVLAP